MKRFVPLIVLLALYAVIIGPFTRYLTEKPVVEKLGYVPEPDVMRLLAADQCSLMSATLMVRVISYYGGLVEQAMNKVPVTPEYQGMYKMLETAVKLDPYNMDAYYFAQAILGWRAGQVREINSLLEYGMQYRKWDWYLPSFAGFNYAYFLKDYKRASQNYRRVAELTGDTLSMNLAGRYMYESGRTDLAVAYLTAMVQGARNEAIKRTLQTRLRAFEEVRKIEQARDKFRSDTKRNPRSLSELLHKGYLARPPVDPYGGTFYLDEKGAVRSTSKFAFGVVDRRR
jgi:hypothetical protein